MEIEGESAEEQILSLTQQLEQLKEEKHLLEASYEKALTSLADSEAKMETLQGELKLAHDQMTTMWEELGRQQVTNPLSPLPHPESSPELPVQCTLCGDNMRQRDVENHSNYCSANSNDLPVASSVPSVAMGTDALIVSVTRAPSAAATWAPFKVVTKSGASWMNGRHFNVYRSQGDFQWLFEALQEECPERIVPPLRAQISLHATVAEFQRFMSRLANHRIFCKHHLFILFLSGSLEDIQSARAKHHPLSRQPGQETLFHSNQDKHSGALVIAKEYLSALEHNLTGLLREMESSGTHADCPASYWFRNISEAEPNNTYLKEAASSLCRVCADMEQHQAESDEAHVICQNLESILSYLRAALSLLSRVEQAVDRFLYWDEEVRICEEVVQDNDNDGEDSGLSEASEPPANQRSTEATACCQESKDYLEMMCRDLAPELANFDYQKEVELRSVFLEYAALFCEKFQRFQSKWYSLNVILDSDIKLALRAIHFQHSNIY